MKSVFKSFNTLILSAYSLTNGGGTLARYIQWNLDLTNLYKPKSLV